jgi:DNA anti-recombination protein RmuC
MYELLHVLVTAADPAGLGDPSVWVRLLEQTPLAAVCVVLAFVVRYLYRGKEALHDQLLAREQEHQAKLEEMASLLHEINLVNMEKNFASTQRWQETIDNTTEAIEERVSRRFNDHLKAEEEALSKINTCLTSIDTFLVNIKDRTGARITQQITNVQGRFDEIKTMLERRRQDVKDDHKRSREDLIREINDVHRPLADVLTELKGKIDGLL